MPGLSVHPYGGEVIFLVNSNATMNYTYQPNCSGSDGHGNGVKGGEGAAAAAAAAAIKVPLWSVSIVDGKSCAVVFNSAAATVAAYDAAGDNNDDDDDTHHRLAKASDGGTDGGRTGAPSETWWAKSYRLTPIFR